ncbi:MAG: heliorhodopsin HeR [Gordonia paraffinivorans]
MTAIASGLTDERLAGLWRWNIGLTVLHAAQAIAVLVLANGFSITVTSTFPVGPPGTAPPAPETLFDVSIGVAIAVFLALAAVDHLVTATVGRRLYENDLRRGINRFRWIEYSVSASIMIVLIAFYFGVTNIDAVIAVFGANVAMILFGWLQERANPPGRDHTTMLPFWFGCVAGVVPWVVIVVNFVGAGSRVPGFVVAVFVSLLIFFSTFAVNQWLQYRGIGPWRSYAFGEKSYLVLSLVAKSLLAWQIFGGSLAG